MNKQLNLAIIILLMIVVSGLSLMLIQNQNTINEQRATIAMQQQKITELEGQLKEIQAKQNTVNTAIESISGVIKDKGMQIIQEKLQR